jgi:hypothetical protein
MLSTLLYSFGSQTLKAEYVRKLKAFVRTSSWEVLRICWKDMVSNYNIWEDLNTNTIIVDKIRARKLEWFGLICRMSDNSLMKRSVAWQS